MFKKRDVAIHFVGIGGIGMSGIAEVLLNPRLSCVRVDQRASEATRRLEVLGGQIQIGHRAEQVQGADVVVISSAVKPDNPEVLAARRRNIPVIPRAEMLGELIARERRRRGGRLARQDQHHHYGRTILAHAGLDPTAIIGGKAKVFGSNARLGQGEVLVAEADESDGSFRHLIPMVAVITNIDREHMDHYGTEVALREAFVDFANKVPFYGLVVLCADNPVAAGLAADLQKRHVTYGLSAGDYRGEILSADAQGTRLRVAVHGKARGEVWVRMPGIHYAQNALAALCVSDVFDVPFRSMARRWLHLPAWTGAFPCAARRAGFWWWTTTATTQPRSPPPWPPRAFSAGACWLPSSPPFHPHARFAQGFRARAQRR